MVIFDIHFGRCRPPSSARSDRTSLLTVLRAILNPAVPPVDSTVPNSSYSAYAIAWRTVDAGTKTGDELDQVVVEFEVV
jgi:hypothetical protein